MRTYLALGIAVLCLLCVVPLHDHHVGPASSADVAALVGGKQCYYPNPTTCVHAEPEEDCFSFCWWDDAGNHDPDDPLWGWLGAWRCPEGADWYIEIVSLDTTIKTDTLPAAGWNGDQEKAEEEDCNVIYACGCDLEYPPSSGFYSGIPPFCDAQGFPFDPPTGTFREVTGDQDCKPWEP